MKKLIILAAMFATPALATDYLYPPPAPPAIVEEPPPPVVVQPERRCHVVRETKHDDILDTNDWVEHEECD